MSKLSISSNHLVVQSNTLVQMHPDPNMTLTEHRFFKIFISRLNPGTPKNPIDFNNPVNQTVRFSLSEFRELMEFADSTDGVLDKDSSRSRITGNYIRRVAERLLSRNIEIISDTQWRKINLFAECRVDYHEDGTSFISFVATNIIMPYLLNLTGNFTSYMLRNILPLKSTNQIRMFELCAQQLFKAKDNNGQFSFTITIDELKKELGIAKEKYPRYNSFREKVLEPCQAALELSTELCFDFEPTTRRGKANKILELKFTVRPNPIYRESAQVIGAQRSDPEPQGSAVESYTIATRALAGGSDPHYTPSAPERHEPEAASDPYGLTNDMYRSRIELFRESAFRGEFSIPEVELINQLTVHYYPDSLKCCNYLLRMHSELRLQESRLNIRNRFKYLCGIIKNDLEQTFEV